MDRPSMVWMCHWRGGHLTNTGANDDGSGDAGAPLLIYLWRWTEIDTNIGTFSFGRMPVHWGSE